MTDQSSDLLCRLDQAPVPPAPLDDIVRAGRAMRARRRRTLVVGAVSAVLLLTGGGAITARVLSRPAGPTTEASPPGSTVAADLGAVGLATRVIPWRRLEGGHWPAESADYQATYVPEQGMVVYRSRAAYSTSCPPVGAASIDPTGGLTLTLSEAPATSGSCTADATVVVAVVRGIPDDTPLRSLTVTEPDGTYRVTVMERVPDVAGSRIADARRTLGGASLDVRVGGPACRAGDGCDGVVVDTVPPIDTAVPIGSTVTLVTRGRRS